MGASKHWSSHRRVKLNVLVGCERSGVVRRAFRSLGCFAMSCDLDSPDDDTYWHYQGDVRDLIYDKMWHLAIFHPPCTYLSVSGLHWNKKNPERAQKTEEALEFVRILMDCPIPHICIENPISCISSRIRKPDQIVQPYQFGDDASKSTCLWLKGLPILHHTERVSGRLVEWPPNSGRMTERWSNQCDSGQNKLGPSPNRAQLRAQTYPGIANAMAEQWSKYLQLLYDPNQTT